MEQTGGREELKAGLPERPSEGIVCDIHPDRGYPVFPVQSWSVCIVSVYGCGLESVQNLTYQGNRQPYYPLAGFLHKSTQGVLTYHHVFAAVMEVRGLSASGPVGLRLIPIANEILAAWPEYRYATGKQVRIRQQAYGARHTVRIEFMLTYFALEANQFVSTRNESNLEFEHIYHHVRTLNHFDIGRVPKPCHDYRCLVV